jgi:hypothetical protein
MSTSRSRDVPFTVHNMPEAYRDPSTWRACDVLSLPEQAQARVHTFKKAIEGYLCTMVLHTSAADAEVSDTEFLRVFSRCLRLLDDGKIWGWPALVKGARSSKNKRIKPIAEGATGGGLTGAFTLLLMKYPSIRKAIHDAMHGLADVKPSRQSYSGVCTAFYAACRTAGLTDNDYPFTTPNAAARSVRFYSREYLNGHTERFELFFGHASKAQLKVGTGITGFQIAAQPFDVVGIDAHRLDVIAKHTVMTEHGPVSVPIRRLWLILLRDYVSGAILGYSISHGEQVTAEAVERAIVCSQTRWVRRKLQGGLVYVKGAGLPYGSVEGLQGCPIAVLRMDNFSSHYSNIIQEGARRAMGFHINFGAVGNWWTNAPLERFFRMVAARMHVLPSSTGSGPADPLRPENANREAVENEIEWEYIHDLLEVELTAENVRPGAGRSHMKPLEILRNHVESAEMGWLPRFPVPLHAGAPRLGWEARKVRIAGSMKAGAVRRPYFERYGRRYTSTALANRFDQIGGHLTVYMRQSDCRVEAFYPDGTSIGEVVQNGGAPLRVIPLATLKMVNRKKNHTWIPENEALEDYVQELTDLTAEHARRSPHKISSAGSDLSEIAQRLLNTSEMPAAIAVSKSELRAPKRKVGHSSLTLPYDAAIHFGRLA